MSEELKEIGKIEIGKSGLTLPEELLFPSGDPPERTLKNSPVFRVVVAISVVIILGLVPAMIFGGGQATVASPSTTTMPDKSDEKQDKIIKVLALLGQRLEEQREEISSQKEQISSLQVKLSNPPQPKPQPIAAKPSASPRQIRSKTTLSWQALSTLGVQQVNWTRTRSTAQLNISKVAENPGNVTRYPQLRILKDKNSINPERTALTLAQLSDRISKRVIPAGTQIKAKTLAPVHIDQVKAILNLAIIGQLKDSKNRELSLIRPRLNLVISEIVGRVSVVGGEIVYQGYQNNQAQIVKQKLPPATITDAQGNEVLMATESEKTRNLDKSREIQNDLVGGVIGTALNSVTYGNTLSAGGAAVIGRTLSQSLTAREGSSRRYQQNRPVYVIPKDTIVTIYLQNDLEIETHAPSSPASSN